MKEQCTVSSLVQLSKTSGDLLVICGTGWIMLKCSWMLKPEIDDIEKRSSETLRDKREDVTINVQLSS